jgi:FAD:protein FMN transferase
MNNRTRNVIYSIVLLVAVLVFWKYRQRNTPIHIEGKTMGTSYNIIYFDNEGRNLKADVDSILTLINKSISTYDTASEISIFNRSRSFQFKLPYFFTPLQISKQVVTASQGSYDPTVMPLVNAWGFGPKKIVKPDTTTVELVKQYVGFEKLSFNQDSVWKNDPRVQLDFSGIGQGYGADVVADFLKSKGIEHALVEIGGEGMAVGRNIKTNKPWALGIVDPLHPDQSKGYVTLENKSFSTSGNYFNYREVNGRRYSHTIDPATGYPSEKAILSASVFANDCATADAWATAFMCMGHEKAIEILKTQTNLGACLFYSTEAGTLEAYVTENMKAFISFEEPK